MTPAALLSARWTPALLPAIAPQAAAGRAARPVLPPREVWPLLGTILATALVMLTVILWHAAPAIAAAIVATAASGALLALVMTATREAPAVAETA